MSRDYEYLSAELAPSLDNRIVRSKGLYNRFGKRILDVLLVLSALPIVLPVILIVALLVRSDGGPAFFGHERIGRGGKPFKCWKVRSMVPNAEAKLRAVLEADPVIRATWEKDFKLEEDPRITRLGRFLRRSSLDELPQLFNVLMGQMSLIGPRPVTGTELRRYGSHSDVILALRPGVSGLWQVSGRNGIDYDERIKLDLDYTRNISFKTDLQIIFKTILTVLLGTGK